MSDVADPWHHILQSLNQEYDLLNYAMERGPFLKLRLYKRNVRWYLTLEEVWPLHFDLKIGTLRIDDHVNWCNNILTVWGTSKRESWNTWSFTTKKDAEKFITYYNIACPQ